MIGSDCNSEMKSSAVGERNSPNPWPCDASWFYISVFSNFVGNATVLGYGNPITLNSEMYRLYLHQSLKTFAIVISQVAERSSLEDILHNGSGSDGAEVSDRLLPQR